MVSVSREKAAGLFDLVAATLRRFFWGKWHRILFMAEKGKYKTTIVAVCYRCSRSRLGKRACAKEILCVWQALPPLYPLPHHCISIFFSLWSRNCDSHVIWGGVFRFCRKGHRRVKCLREPNRISRRCKSLVLSSLKRYGDLAAFLLEPKQTVSAVICIYLISVFLSTEHWFYYPDGSRGRHKRQVGGCEPSPDCINDPPPPANVWLNKTGA